MNDPLHDQRVRDWVLRLQAEDRQEMPAFDELLNRSARPASPRASYWRVMALACVAAVCLAAWFAFSGGARRSGEPELQTAVPGHAQPETAQEEIDFERLQALVDSQFESFGASAWRTPTDSLLAMSFNTSSGQE